MGHSSFVNSRNNKSWFLTGWQVWCTVICWRLVQVAEFIFIDGLYNLGRKISDGVSSTFITLVFRKMK